MKKLFALVCAAVLLLALTACGGSSETPTPTASPTLEATPTPTPEPTPEPTEPELSEYEQAKQEILAHIDVGYSGLTPAGAPMYFLASSDGEYVALVLENTDNERYIKFIGSAVVDDDSGIMTVTDSEKGYTFGFSAEKQSDGTFLLDCGDLGVAYLESDEPGSVVDYIFMAFQNKDDATDDLIDAMAMLSILDYVDIAYSGLTAAGGAMYYLASTDSPFAALILENADKQSYLQFVGTTAVDENGLQTVTDSEKGYTFGFIAEDMGDGSYFLNCGDLGECYLELDTPENVVSYMNTAFRDMEDVTDAFMVEYGRS